LLSLFYFYFFFPISQSYVFILPKANECMCTFWVHPSNWWVILKSTHLLVGFLLKIWMLGNWFNHAFISFLFFFELSLAFLYHEVSHHYEMWKKIIWLIF
jgi:hypothetical protein